jgi:hypothetical protein
MPLSDFIVCTAILEYDSCTPAICRMLEGGADEVRLTAYLGQVRTDAMGLAWE